MHPGSKSGLQLINFCIFLWFILSHLEIALNILGSHSSEEVEDGLVALCTLGCIYQRVGRTHPCRWRRKVSPKMGSHIQDYGAWLAFYLKMEAMSISETIINARKPAGSQKPSNQNRYLK